MNKPVLECIGIAAGYVKGLNILNGIDLTLGSGEIVSIIGPNGAGKSTLLKAIVGIIKINGGRFYLNGVEKTNTPTYKIIHEGVGYVPQVNNVFPSLTLLENLEMGNRKNNKKNFADVYELFPLLKERSNEKAGNLSGGQRQMLALGRALISKPDILLLDEPSAGLSPNAVDEVFESIIKINKTGVSILIVEQNARRSLKISNRGYVLDQGRNAYSGFGENLLNDEKVIELYLGKM
jgi:branched-chain amino acid transport system ATP-binding protein|tara:strand:- start:287 stop:994 length:708 start_codon:yes stop_codon:yes gene_type:complete